jgi:hypothetical protein
MDYWIQSYKRESDQWTGSTWKLIGPQGQMLDAGKIAWAGPPRRLVIR